MVSYLPSGSSLEILLSLSYNEGFTKDLDVQMGFLYELLV